MNLTATPVGGSGSFEYQFRLKGSDQNDNWSILRDFDSNPNIQVSTSSFVGKNIFQVRARNSGTLDKYARARSVLWVNQLNPVTSVGLTASDTDVIWGDSITLDLSVIGGDGSFYLTKELKQPGEGKYEGDGFFRQTSDTQFTFDVGGIQPGTYRMRVQVMNAATDKPVKSASVKFEVSENPAPEWQAGGSSYDNIQSCSIYECPCMVLNTCSVEADGVTIIGY